MSLPSKKVEHVPGKALKRLAKAVTRSDYFVTHADKYFQSHVDVG